MNGCQEEHAPTSKGDLYMSGLIEVPNRLGVGNGEIGCVFVIRLRNTTHNAKYVMLVLISKQ